MIPLLMALAVLGGVMTAIFLANWGGSSEDHNDL